MSKQIFTEQICEQKILISPFSKRLRKYATVASINDRRYGTFIICLYGAIIRHINKELFPSVIIGNKKTLAFFKQKNFRESRHERIFKEQYLFNRL